MSRFIGPLLTLVILVVYAVSFAGLATAKPSPPSSQPSPSTSPGSATQATPQPSLPPVNSTPSTSVGLVTKIEVASVTAMYGQNVNLSVTLSPAGAAAAGNAKQMTGSVTFYVDDQSVANVPTYGTASTWRGAVCHMIQPFQPPTSLKAGTHTIKASYSGDQTYLAVEGTAALEISKAKTALTLSNVGEMPQNPHQIGGAVGLARSTDNTGIDGRVVSLVLDGKTVCTATTQAGQAFFQFNTPKGTPTNAKLEAQFSGDDKYLSSSTTTNFYAGPPAITPVVYVPQLPLFTITGAKTTLTAYMYRDAAKTQPIAGKKLDFTLMAVNAGGQVTATNLVCSGVTNAAGQATGTFTCLQPAGLNAICVQFWHDPSSPEYTDGGVGLGAGNGVLNIAPGPLTVGASLDKMSAHIGQTVTVTATVYRKYDGHGAPGLPVNFVINGTVLATVNTDPQGHATAKIELPSSLGVGNTTLQVQVPASALFSAGAAKCAFDILPADN